MVSKTVIRPIMHYNLVEFTSKNVLEELQISHRKISAGNIRNKRVSFTFWNTCNTFVGSTFFGIRRDIRLRFFKIPN